MKRIIQLNRTFQSLFSQQISTQLQQINTQLEQKHKVTLTNRIPISHDTYIFTFTYDHITFKIDQFVSQHFVLLQNFAKIFSGESRDGNKISRKYTATSPLSNKGEFSIPIKIYRPNSNPLFPDGGELSTWLERLVVRCFVKLKIGSHIWVEQKVGPILYLGNGNCILSPKINQQVSFFKHILMTCGGTGITPMYQLIQRILNDPSDLTKITLLYANKSEQDILLKDNLEKLRRDNPSRFNLHFSIDQKDESWKGLEGYVTLDMMKQVFPKPDHEILGTRCGHKSMNLVVLQLYKDFGLDENQILKF